jgi:hypothetical protein
VASETPRRTTRVTLSSDPKCSLTSASAPAVLDAQLISDASQELWGPSFYWQRAAQKEQVPGLYRFHVGAERGRRTRQVYAKLF